MSAAGAFPGFLNGARPKSRMPRAGIWFLGKGNNPIPTSKRVWGAEIRPPATPKPLNRSSPKITRVIRSRISTNKQNLVTIPQEVSFPRMRKIAHQRLLGFFLVRVLPTAYSPGPWTDFHVQYVKQRGSGQGCVFSGLENKSLTYTPRNTRKTPFFGPILTGQNIFGLKTPYNGGAPM